ARSSPGTCAPAFAGTTARGCCGFRTIVNLLDKDVKMVDILARRDSMEKIEVAGFPGLRIRGAGRPLVMFLHGSFATHEPFAPWMERIGGACVALSRRGRLGVGPERAAGVRFADYLEDTLKAIDALGEAPILVGHSLGALIAQKVAELGRARGLALLSPAPA